MAYDNLGFCKSIKSTNSLFSPRQQYYFVALDTNGQIIVNINNHGNQGVIGVVQDTPLAGDPGLVCGLGAITKVMCGGTITAGQAVMSDNLGRAVAATSGLQTLGYALTAGAVNYLADIVFQPFGALV